ncbi:MAG: hypothetical protein SFV15_18010 [Polyangiaceae bacterium]|nr:hypothetical protein [Polyangiaceae bacterium]
MHLKLATAFSAFLATLVCGATAHAEDQWFGEDKALHFGVSVGLASSSYALSSLFVEDSTSRILAGTLGGLMPGAAKELYDATGRGDPSWKDFAWDATGTLVGVSVAYLADLALRPEHPTSRPAGVAQGLVLVW